jgi:hypothetical protein
MVNFVHRLQADWGVVALKRTLRQALRGFQSTSGSFED